MNKNPKYLVRNSDYHIFELDESTDCYRSYTNQDIHTNNGIRLSAALHMTYDCLMQSGVFFQIEENEISIYEEKHQQYMNYLKWFCRPDGHGGRKGGTMEEYLQTIK
ncbi:MAG: hypothetical protein M0R17_12045 [Candidatus Omnitrophica bacterium]|jgi:hypothetical protein|nr:hypothetical protein [Candidatus Omnitrophota bacterium]